MPGQFPPAADAVTKRNECSKPEVVAGTAQPARVIMHVDCDKFFLAVHTLHEPSLGAAGPLVLWQYNDVICVSPEAAKAGVRKHMRPTEAQPLVQQIGGTMVHAFTRKWPGARVWYGPYLRSSREFFQWMRAYFDKELKGAFVLERASIDEAFVDVSVAVGGSLEAAADLGTRLARAAQDVVGIPVTVGIARARAISKLASSSAKPPEAGLRVVRDGPHDVQDLLRQTSAARLPGLAGKKVQLEALGAETAADLQPYDAEFLRTALELASPDAAMKLAALSHGQDAAAVRAADPKQSISVSSWVTDCMLGDLASKKHLGRGGAAFVIGNGWLFEPHEGAGKGITNHTRARWILLSLAIDLEERLVEENLEFGSIPSKLTITVMGPGTAKEPGVPGFTDGRSKCRSGPFPHHAFQSISAADSKFAVSSSSQTAAPIAKQEAHTHSLYGTEFLTITSVRGPAQDGPHILEDGGRRKRVAAIVDAASSMISAWASDEQSARPVAHLALTARAMSASTSKSPAGRTGAAQLSLAQAFSRKRPRSTSPSHAPAPIDVDEDSSHPSPGARLTEAGWKYAPTAVGGQPPPRASWLSVPSIEISDSE